MKDQQVSYDIYTPFGPRILKSSVPQVVIDAVNQKADTILQDNKKSNDLDYSSNLAGNVKKEVALSLAEVKGLEVVVNKLATEYIMKLVPNQLDPEKTIMSYSSWVVSQYAGDFNPLHIHDSQLSGVLFLKMHSWLVKPQIGDLYLFPSWLSHQVYPFRSEGERRSMAFNIHLRSKVPGTDVGKGIDK